MRLRASGWPRSGQLAVFAQLAETLPSSTIVAWSRRSTSGAAPPRPPPPADLLRRRDLPPGASASGPPRDAPTERAPPHLEEPDLSRSASRLGDPALLHPTAARQRRSVPRRRLRPPAGPARTSIVGVPWAPWTSRTTSCSTDCGGLAGAAHRRAGHRAHARRAARRRRRGGPAHRVVRLRLPGQPARRPRPDAGPGARSSPERRSHARAGRQRGARRHRACGAASEVPGHGRPSTAWSASGTARRPASTGRGDPLRHGNMCGAHPSGGVLRARRRRPELQVLHHPVHQRAHAAGYGLPVLYPGTAEEIVPPRPLRDRAVARVRHVGRHEDHRRRRGRRLDASTARLGEPRRSRCRRWSGRAGRGSYRQFPMLVPPGSLEAEAQMYGPRWAMVRAFLRAPTRSTPSRSTRPTRGWASWRAARRSPTSGRRCATSASTTTRSARRRHPAAAARHDPPARARSRCREFAARPRDGARRRGEAAVRRDAGPRHALRHGRTRPPSSASATPTGAPLVPVAGELTAGALAAPLRRVLASRVELQRPRRAASSPLPLLPVARTAYFCSGCPHNRSTSCPRARSPAAASAATPWSRHRTARRARSPGRRWAARARQWIGQAPFTDAGHMFQNIGDGTFAHSGQLAVQACVAAGVSTHLQAALQPTPSP